MRYRIALGVIVALLVLNLVAPAMSQPAGDCPPGDSCQTFTLRQRVRFLERHVSQLEERLSYLEAYPDDDDN